LVLRIDNQATEFTNPIIEHPRLSRGPSETPHPRPGNHKPRSTNPAITNPAITNPASTNPDAGGIESAITNPAITNPAITNPAITNPPSRTQRLQTQSITDASFPLTNTGNTHTSYAVKLSNARPLCQWRELATHPGEAISDAYREWLATWRRALKT